MAEPLDEGNGKEETSQKKSSPLVLIIVIVVLVFTLIIGGIIVALLMSGDDAPVAEQYNEQTDSNSRSSAPSRQKPSKRIESTVVGPMFPLDGFTVNLLSDSGRRYLKATINLELSDERVARELESKSPVIRDVVITILTSKTLEEIATSKGKEKLKDQLVSQVNLRLQDGEVKNIYFVEFVIQ